MSMNNRILHILENRRKQMLGEGNSQSGRIYHNRNVCLGFRSNLEYLLSNIILFLDLKNS